MNKTRIQKSPAMCAKLEGVDVDGKDVYCVIKQCILKRDGFPAKKLPHGVVEGYYVEVENKRCKYDKEFTTYNPETFEPKKLYLNKIKEEEWDDGLEK